MSHCCPKCGTIAADGTRFCKVCGASLAASATPAQEAPSYNSYSQPQTPPSWDNRLVDPSETIVATLENGRLDNIISGEGILNEDAILTNKRLYYNHKHGIINVVNVQEKVNISDITGTKISDVQQRGLLILAGLFLLIGIVFAAASGTGAILPPMLVIAAILVLAFFISMKKHLVIEYAGGKIAFSVKKYNMEKVRAFQNCIHALKDQYTENK